MVSLATRVRHLVHRASGWSLIVNKELIQPPFTHQLMIPVRHADAYGDIRFQVTLRNPNSFLVQVNLGWIMQGYTSEQYGLKAGTSIQVKPTLRGLLDRSGSANHAQGYLLPVYISDNCYVEVWAL